MTNNVAVVIVNWNAGMQILECCQSLLRYGGKCINEIIVVDNGSTDDSILFLKDFSGIAIVEAGQNLGFGKACNLGASLCHSKYILFLNPDACLESDILGRVIDFMNHPDNQSVGICGVQLRDGQGNIAKSCARFPSLGQFVAHSTGLDRIFPRLGHLMHEWDHTSNSEVNHVIGAFFFVRRKLFQDLSGFDEDFFVYLEDLDFSYRAKKNGYSSVFLADIQAFHAGGGTSKHVKAKRLFYSLRSRLIYSFKHFNFISALLVCAVTLFMEPISRSTMALLRRSWSVFKETLVAYGMLVCWLPRWIFKGETR